MIDKINIIEWIEEHDTACEDAHRYFNTDDLETVDIFGIIVWLLHHETLYEDYLRHFGSHAIVIEEEEDGDELSE